MTPAALAPEIDRLVWAVNFRCRDHHVDHDVFESVGLSPAAFGTLNNLLPFLDHLSEQMVRRRYIYRPAEAIDGFLAVMREGGFLVDDNGRLAPTERLAPVVDHLRSSMQGAAHFFWTDHVESVRVATGPAREVLEASSYDLAVAAAAAPEPADGFVRFHQRLAGLRLLRNEAHVASWRARDLSPSEVEMLTAAWAGTPVQSPGGGLGHLEELGYVVRGTVTDAGLAARQAIEDDTNTNVASAFASIDQSAFLEALQAMPPDQP